MITFINNLDKIILFFIHNNFHFPVLDKVMILATFAGDKGLIWILISILLLINKKTRVIGIMSLGALILSAFLGEGLLKHIVQRQRPYADFTWVHLLIDKSTKYSFPSGHTSSSFAAAFILSKYLKRFSLVFWILAFLIAFSRLYLFMHYPIDVIGGIVLGLICGKTISCICEHIIKGKISTEINGSIT